MIQQLSESDLDTFWNLRLRAVKEDVTISGSSYDEEQSQTREQILRRFFIPDINFTLGYYKRETLIGIISFRREMNYKMRHRSSIYSFYVVPEERRRGYGRQLLQEVLRLSRKFEGIEQISLFVIMSNHSAHNLYTSFGFEQVGYEKETFKIDNQYYDGVSMVLRLGDHGD